MPSRTSSCCLPCQTGSGNSVALRLRPLFLAEPNCKMTSSLLCYAWHTPRRTDGHLLNSQHKTREETSFVESKPTYLPNSKGACNKQEFYFDLHQLPARNHESRHQKKVEGQKRASKRHTRGWARPCAFRGTIPISKGRALEFVADEAGEVSGPPVRSRISGCKLAH